MSWETELVRVLRHYIDDLDDTAPKYTDQRLQELIVVSALRVHNEINFHQTYTIDLENIDIVPDPTAISSRDEDFMVLTCYKAAQIVALSEYKTTSGQSIFIKDGSSAVDLRNISAQKKGVADFYAKAYEDAKFLYQLAERPTGVAILGPVSIFGGYYGSDRGYTFRDRPAFI